jgi:P-type E1-E2 ATPase
MLGMDAVFAECPPEGKAAVVHQLQQQGHKVAFIGDGVNDAPALIAADVGLAMPRGADLARATADIVLLDEHLHTLLAARHLSIGTLKLIQTHFQISTVVNTGVIVGAAAGMISPVWSALLHNGMTLGVLFNSMAGVRTQFLYKNKEVPHG